MNPLLSVIVPAYNCVKFVDKTIESLFDQDYDNIEIIVVNDGSTDSSLSVLQCYGDKIVLVDQVNQGVAAARNAGIALAKGDFISFCDSDDIWSVAKASSQINYLLANPDVDMVYSDWLVWEPDENGCFIVPDWFNSVNKTLDFNISDAQYIYHNLLLDCLCLTSTVMFKRTIFAKLGMFDTELKCGEDYDYWLRASRLTKIGKLKKQLVLYRSWPESITSKPTGRHYEYEVLKKAINQWGRFSTNGQYVSVISLARRMANMKFQFGYLHLKSGDLCIAKNAFWAAIGHYPIWYLPWLYFMLSWFYCVKKFFINESVG